jgi:hypothetical protein
MSRNKRLECSSSGKILLSGLRSKFAPKFQSLLMRGKEREQGQDNDNNAAKTIYQQAQGIALFINA